MPVKSAADAAKLYAFWKGLPQPPDELPPGTEQLKAEHLPLLMESPMVTFGPDGRIEVQAPLSPKVRIKGKPGYGRVEIGGHRPLGLVSATVTKKGDRTKVVLEFENGYPRECVFDRDSGRTFSSLDLVPPPSRIEGP